MKISCEIKDCDFVTKSSQVMRKHLNKVHNKKNKAGRKKVEGVVPKTQKEMSDAWYSKVGDLMKRERAWNKSHNPVRRGKWFTVWRDKFKAKLWVNTEIMYKLDGLPNNLQKMPDTFCSTGSPVRGGKKSVHLGNEMAINFKLSQM